MKVLIIQTAFIGDVVLSTPLYEAAKKRLGADHIGVLVKPETANLLHNNPNVDEIVTYDKKGKQRGIIEFIRLALKLRNSSYNIALIPHQSFRSALLAYIAKIPNRVGYNRNINKNFFTTSVPYQANHEVKRNLSLLNSWKVDTNRLKPTLYPAQEDKFVTKSLVKKFGMAPTEQICGVSPGSVWATKQWLPDRFAEFIKRLFEELGYRSVIFGSIEDRMLCEDIARKSGVKPLNVAGNLSLLQSAALAARCTAFLSNDSGMGHVAAAVGTPVVSLFGPTVPDFGFTPYGTSHKVIEVELNCRPCSPHGGNKCPLKTHDCMQKITVKQVLDVLASQFQAKKNS